jgi:alkylation response protein AidB-like acyl-CoA dehydrogenase
MSSIVEVARELGELIEAHADEAERERRLPMALVERLRVAGLLRMCVPKAYGGPECDPITILRAIEAVSTADGAAGWCTMIASTTSSLSMFLPPVTAKELFGDPACITGGVFAPNGTAQPVPGGWEVSGRWMWGSGTQHCQWIAGGAMATDDAGDPAVHLFFFDAHDVTILDTWHTSGLRGTGSNDFTVDRAFVPADRVVRPMSAVPTVDCALSSFPNFTLLSIGVAAVALGIARHAIDEFTELAQSKTPQFAHRTLSESGSVQAELARAEATLRSARALLFFEVGEAWATAQAGDEVDVSTRARIRLAGVHAAQSAATCVDSVYTMAGGAAVYQTSVLQRCLRDVHVATQHIMVSPRMYETLGKMFLGGRVDASMF